jgi:hypothetical protein
VLDKLEAFDCMLTMIMPLAVCSMVPLHAGWCAVQA